MNATSKYTGKNSRGHHSNPNGFIKTANKPHQTTHLKSINQANVLLKTSIMVRLMKWMLGLLFTCCSTAFAVKTISTKSTLSGNYNLTKDDHDADDSNKPKNSTSLHMSTTVECIPVSINEFPSDFMTEEQRSKGGLVLHFILSMYACYALAAVCDTYFVPSLQIISDHLGLPSDVAGATFMAAGTSSPEFFESIIGSFVTEGDIGVGTIVGSAVFNILAVTSVCGILTGMVVPLDWWPLTRDCVFYAITVVVLVFVIYDEKVYWYESAVLLVMFVMYVLIMYFNTRIASLFGVRVVRNSKNNSIEQIPSTDAIDPSESIAVISSSKVQDNGIVRQTAIAIANGTLEPFERKPSENGHLTVANGYQNGEVNRILLDENMVKITTKNDEDDHEDHEWSPTNIPAGSFLTKLSYFITWPINFLFYLTIPNCNKARWYRFYPLTFFMSIMYIGSLSYFVAWMVTIMGFTIGVPDTVMGITFLAIGTSVPEGYSSVIVCRKGLGNMAISNSVGSNVFDILFCLGFPWLIKALAFSTTGYVQINSSGLVYSAMTLLATVILLYLVIVLCKFQLNLKVGVICLILYSGFLTFASLVELNVLGNVNPPLCS